MAYAVTAAAYLLGAAAVAHASKGRWRAVTLVVVAITGLIALLPIHYFGAPIVACDGMDGPCYVDYGSSTTTIGLTVHHTGDLDGPRVGHGTLFVLGLTVTALAVLVAGLLASRSARLRQT